MCTPKYINKGDIMETKVGIKEFRAYLPSYLNSMSPIAVTRHGETIGYFIPTRSSRNQEELNSLKKAAIS